MISATLSATDSGAGTSARSSCANTVGSIASNTRSDCIQALQQAVDRAGLQLVGDRVGDQPRRAHCDPLADPEPVLPQWRPRRREVDDALDQAGQRRQLDRALDLDDLRLTPGREEVPRGY